MNYLAHAVLSFDNPSILTGNMISDFVKGRRKYLYPESIRRGIELHRLIDRFTDEHESTAEAKSFFRPTYRLYSGAFVDVVYDHFLANDSNEFANASHLLRFSDSVYRTLEKNRKVLPVVFASLFPYMKNENWLYNYRLVTGIQKSFGGLVRRALYMHDPGPAFRIFNENYTTLQLCYEHFFPDVKQFVLQSLSNLPES